MTKNKFIKSGALALSAAVLVALPAKGALITASSSELFLGFRATGSDDADQTYIVELGAVGTFTNTPGTTINLSLGNIDADLSAQFGEDWSSRADLSWGIFGSADSTTPTILYTSRERPTLATRSNPWPTLSLTDAAAPRNSILQLRNLINVGGGTASTSNSNFGFFQSSTGTGTYAQALSPSSNPGAPDFGAWSRIEGDFGDGTAGTALDLYKFTVVNNSDTTVAYRGTFTITDAGAVTYSNLVPEPSAALLATIAGPLLLGLRRRRAATTA